MALLPSGFSAAGGGYQISRSLRFNSADSAYLNRTFAGTPNTYTISCWVKRGALTSDQYIAASRAGASTDGIFGFNASDQLYVVLANTYVITTTSVYRDPSAWYHIVLSVTASGNAYLYVNNTQVGTVAVGASAWLFNSTNTNTIGRWGSNASRYLDGYLTEINFIDGQALTPSSFGQTDPNTGVWSPIKYTGTYGTNGFYLNFSDNSGTTSTTLGKDSSGNGNNWTPNNFSVTAGAGNDSLVDTPTPYGTDTGAGGEVRGNYCTINPLLKGTNLTIANGNLDVNSNSNWTTAYGTFLIPSTGKWYWEVTAGGSNTIPGIASAASNLAGNLATYPANTLVSYTYYGVDGNKYTGPGNTGAAYGATFTTNDVIGIAFDAGAGTLTFYKNGVSQGQAFSGLTVTYIPVFGVFDSGIQAINFGQRPFAYTAPSGYKALCTQNLPTPTIGATSTTTANKYMDVSLYSGTSASQSVTNSGSMQPDLVWIKSRSAATDNKLTDAVRGTTKGLISNTTGAETTDTNGLTAFNSNGFTVGSDSVYNNGTGPATYVAWQWNAGGSNATNTSGTITSTVRANTTAGFSIVTYTGTGANATVGHGLGVAPSMVIVKNRDAVNGWVVYHSTIGATQYLELQLTNAAATAIQAWNNTAPTATTITVGTAASVNGSTNKMVAYCFAPVAGYSAFGSYAGNGSADGPFVYTGFRPRFVMVKYSSSTGDWMMNDTARDTYNVVSNDLKANVSNAEVSFAAMDITSNSFKIRTTDAEWNQSGGTYIYAAFAESPFKYSLAR